ncbi:MAG: 3-carboxy-cis,cis-muconate cycloisomerase [Gemmatimonas sp.]
MPSTPFDSALFRDFFGTEPMRAVFADEALVARYLEVEAALARAEARLGIIPERAAAEISAKADLSIIDMARLRRETERVGYPILPLVRQIAERCADGLGEYAHWGATTQDIMDCAVVLQVRDALALVESDLAAIGEALAKLARRHRTATMAGRTHLQHALPITFGYKAAVWLAAIDRHRVRLAELRPRALVAEFGGAAGTLASLGDKGLDVRRELANELKLAEPAITWHVMRDGLAEVVTFLGLVTGTVGKIATDIMLMMQNEVAEAFEPFAPGRGASSTMPQKRNPISCELILACGKGVRQQVALMLDAMVQDHERATGPWHAEWLAMPESFLLTASALHQARFLLEGLEIDDKRMRANLDLTGGLIVAEAVMMALAPKLGRQNAHDVVYDACRRALDEKRPFVDVLKANPDIMRQVSEADLAALVEPANYVGLAAEMVDAVLAGRAKGANRG